MINRSGDDVKVIGSKSVFVIQDWRAMNLNIRISITPIEGPQLPR
jgi:hypothetical protein